MNQWIGLSIALLLLSLTNASEFVSPSQPPMISPIPEPSNSDCSSVIFEMVDCLSFLTVGSTDLSPTKTCCDGTKSVLQFNPQCFCSALESSSEMGFVLDNTKSLHMPTICNAPIDPHCDLSALSPVASIVSPPAASPITSPSSAKSPAATPSLPAATPSLPAATPSLPAATPSLPAATPSLPAATPSLPAATPSLPAATPSLPAVTPSLPAATPSIPAVAPSVPVVTYSSPAANAPSPSFSSTGSMSVSKLFLAAVLVSSFVYISA